MSMKCTVHLTPAVSLHWKKRYRYMMRKCSFKTKTELLL